MEVDGLRGRLQGFPRGGSKDMTPPQHFPGLDFLFKIHPSGSDLDLPGSTHTLTLLNPL